MTFLASAFLPLVLAAMVPCGSAANITAFSASLRWSFPMGSYVKAMPKLSSDGLTVYSSSGEGCADTANTMFALSADTGSVQWQVYIGFCLALSPSVIACAGAAWREQQRLHAIPLPLRP